MFVPVDKLRRSGGIALVPILEILQWRTQDLFWLVGFSPIISRMLVLYQVHGALTVSVS